MKTHTLKPLIALAIAATASLTGPTAPAHAIDLESMAYKVIDLLPLKEHEKGFAKFTVKSPKCSEKIIESALGDKIMLGMTAAFKVYKPGIKPFDIHSVAECKMKMNPVNFAFSQAMGKSKGLISDMPAPYNSAIQAQADQTLGDFQADANDEMMKEFPFTSYVDCACEAAFHNFSPAIEDTFASIKTGDAKTVGTAVYKLAIESSSLPIKPIELIVEGDIKGAATSLVGQYGIPIGCKVAEYLLGVPSQVCEATAGTIGKGAKLIAGIAEDFYDELAGTAADPNQYYADHWRPYLAISAAYLIGDQGWLYNTGGNKKTILPMLWNACADYYADHANLLDEISFSDDNAARDICDPMRDQYNGVNGTGGDIDAVVKTARQAARDFYETGFKDALYKFATPYAGNPQLIAGPVPWLFAACAKGVDPLVNSIPARNEDDHKALSNALCNDLLLGKDSTVTQDLKAIAASLTPVKTEVQKKKDKAKAEKQAKADQKADYDAVVAMEQSIPPVCAKPLRDQCEEADFHLVYACARTIQTIEPYTLAKAKSCVKEGGASIHQSILSVLPVIDGFDKKCGSYFADKSKRHDCLTKAKAAYFSCGKPSFKDAAIFLQNAVPAEDTTGKKQHAKVGLAMIKYGMAAKALNDSQQCGAVEAYFADLDAKFAKQKAIQDMANNPQETPAGQLDGNTVQLKPGLLLKRLPKLANQAEGQSGGDSQTPAQSLSAGRDLIRLGCKDVREDGKLFACPDDAAVQR